MHCLLWLCWLLNYYPIILPAMYVLVDLVPPHCVAGYACAGWRNATTLCCLQCTCWLVWYQPIVLPAMYVLDGVVLSHCVACDVCSAWCSAKPFVAWYACTGLCGSSPLCSLLCICWMMWCHPIVMPTMYVSVGVVPPHSVAWYVCASWCDATPLCCLVCMCRLV